MAMDQFADIAARGIGGNADLLYDPQPLPHQTRPCKLAFTPGVPYQQAADIKNEQQLSAALRALR